MKGKMIFLPCFHARLYVIESRSWNAEPELLGVFTSFKEAVRTFDLFSNKRFEPFTEGDLLSLYEVKNNTIMWDGLETNVMWRNHWGTFYLSSETQRRIEEIMRKLIEKRSRLISI